MVKVGITGGIGSGKSTVCKIFKILGTPIFYADEVAKHLMTTDKDLVYKLKMNFGFHLFDSENNLNSSKLAKIVFGDNQKLKLLNSLVHPAVFKEADKWNEQHKDAVYTLKEAALLFETGSYLTLDKIILVHASDELRIERAAKRDQTTKTAIKARMKHQWEEVKRLQHADYLIVNDGNSLLIPQVLELHNALREQSRAEK